MNKKNLLIAGIQSLNSSNYNKVRILGICDILPAFSANKVSVIGSLCCSNSVNIKKLLLFGNATFQRVLSTFLLNIYGEGNFHDDIKSEKIIVRGIMTANKKIETDVFYSKGILKIDSLNSNTIKIIINRDCEINEIGADTIEVICGKKKVSYWDILNLILPIYNKKINTNSYLKATSIEADNIYLENSKVKVVRGENVFIGSGCNIDLVEYRQSFQVDKSAIVNDLVKF